LIFIPFFFIFKQTFLCSDKNNKNNVHNVRKFKRSGYIGIVAVNKFFRRDIDTALSEWYDWFVIITN